MTSRPEVVRCPDILNALEAAIFLGIKGKKPERVVQKAACAGRLRGMMVSKKQGWVFHRKALEDAVLMGGLKR